MELNKALLCSQMRALICNVLRQQSARSAGERLGRRRPDPYAAVRRSKALNALARQDDEGREDPPLNRAPSETPDSRAGRPQHTSCCPFFPHCVLLIESSIKARAQIREHERSRCYCAGARYGIAWRPASATAAPASPAESEEPAEISSGGGSSSACLPAGEQFDPVHVSVCPVACAQPLIAVHRRRTLTSLLPHDANMSCKGRRAGGNADEQ